VAKALKKPDPEKPHYAGHRQRLRDRFIHGGAGALADYEMLELILFLAQPRRDVKPLAKRLIDHFGSFAEAISASPESLSEIKGVGESAVIALKTIQAGAQLLAREEILDRPVLSNWQSLMDYCRSTMAFEKNEQFRILFLNTKNVLIADEVQQRGTVDHTPVYPREVVRRALELGASAIIMAHNHPSGDPTPSKGDIEMTNEIRAAGEKLGITLHDHLIVSRSGINSFKTMGLL
jgi:DNA repair protein RadC